MLSSLDCCVIIIHHHQASSSSSSRQQLNEFDGKQLNSTTKAGLDIELMMAIMMVLMMMTAMMMTTMMMMMIISTCGRFREIDFLHSGNPGHGTLAFAVAGVASLVVAGLFMGFRTRR